MPPKHPRTDDSDPDESAASPPPPPKRARPSTTNPATAVDLLTPLSDELLLRILSALTPSELLHSLAPVSRRFHRLVLDAQLWRALYYAHFVLPRALRLPGGFRRQRKKLHYKGRRALWADGRLGGLVREEEEVAGRGIGRREKVGGGGGGVEGDEGAGVDWMRQFKIRYNWARGKCAVEELKLGLDPEARECVHDCDEEGKEEEEERAKMLVKVVEGMAVTADATFGLRAWDLKTREVVAQIDLGDERGDNESAPSCMAVDDRGLGKGALDIAVGFADGSFGVWRLLGDDDRRLVRRHRHEKSSNGELVGMAYAHPYLLTATAAVLVSLYTFDIPEITCNIDKEDESGSGSEADHLPSRLLPPPPPPPSGGSDERAVKSTLPNSISLPAPYLMTSLRSHTSDPPLALSIRKTGRTTIASIAYTFYTRHGWSIGIQDLHLTTPTLPNRPPTITTRLAYTAPVATSTTTTTTTTTSPSAIAPSPPSSTSRGPTTLSYTHPYLLATLPDNTLILHLCTATPAALAISAGIRLWGHTSGISDADITARGKAVSVSERGDEMRVWELEGGGSRAADVGGGGRSVEIRAAGGKENGGVGEGRGEVAGGLEEWQARRNWVGFDDEMVIVLKEARGGRESLLVYDFT